MDLRSFRNVGFWVFFSFLKLFWRRVRSLGFEKFIGEFDVLVVKSDLSGYIVYFLKVL